LLTRRKLLWLASIGAAGLPLFDTTALSSGVAAAAPSAAAGGLKSDPLTMTLEAFADTLIPGHKRYAADYAIAGVSRQAGAVQAGALTFMRYGPTGVAPVLPAFVAAVDAAAVAYIASHSITSNPATVDPTLPPFVGLSYHHRKAMLDGLLNGKHENGDEQLLWFALAGLVFLAYHTAGYLPTARAVREGHPGLKAIGFPKPDHDDLWRFPKFSYRRKLAHRHPHTTRGGNPR
jgi:hypothetical protein